MSVNSGDGIVIVTTPGGVSNVQLYKNYILANGNAGVNATYSGGSMTLSGRRNNITANLWGVYNPGPVVVDFKWNWWGSSTGPYNITNPGGLVNPVTDHVLFTPFWGPPTLTGAIAGNQMVTLSWVAPGYDGGIAVTGYRIFYGTTSDPTTQYGVVLSSSTLSVPVTGLTAGVPYYFGVKTVSSAGSSAISNILSATPFTIPGAPTLHSAVAGSSNVTLTWTAPSYSGTISLTGYKVFYGTTSTPTTQFGSTLSASTLTVDVTTLTAGQLYYFAVVAVNGAGAGPQSNVLTATPFTFSDAPVLSSANAGSSLVSLSWTAPSITGFTPLTGYKVYFGTSATPGTLFGTVGPTVLTVDVTGLNPGQLYYFAVRAVNAAGDSSLSNVLSTTPYTVPSAPTLGTATAGIDLVHLTWTAPSSNGSSDITGYKVFYGTASPPTTQLGGTYSAATLTVDVTGLTPGVTYYFAVKAVNIAGDSVLSNVIGAMPYNVPRAPTNLDAVPGLSTAYLNWTAPSDNGSTITSYNIYRGLTSGAETILTSVGTTGFTDTGLTPSVTYYYRVSAVNLAGEGPLSSEAWATPSNSVMAAPTLTSAVAGSSMVSLTWIPPRYQCPGRSPVTRSSTERPACQPPSSDHCCSAPPWRWTSPL